MDSFDFDVSDIIPIIAFGAVEEELERGKSRLLRSTGVKGGDYMRELLNCGNDQRIYEVLRMQKGTFLSLCTALRKHLKDSYHIKIEEQVGMFLWTINYSTSNGVVAERFQHSKSTVSQYVQLLL
jgi:hypothetical protein